MKDAAFTVRAQLGGDLGRMGNPFTVQGLAGNATRTATSTATFTPARAGGSVSMPTMTSTDRSEASDGLSIGAKAGFGLGVGVGVILIVAMTLLIVRNRKKTAIPIDPEKRWEQAPAELHDVDALIHQISSKAAYPNLEMPGNLAVRHELPVRASVFVVELPSSFSNRNSTQRM